MLTPVGNGNCHYISIVSSRASVVYNLLFPTFFCAQVAERDFRTLSWVLLEAKKNGPTWVGRYSAITHEIHSNVIGSCCSLDCLVDN